MDKISGERTQLLSFREKTTFLTIWMCSSGLFFILRCSGGDHLIEDVSEKGTARREVNIFFQQSSRVQKIYAAAHHPSSPFTRAVFFFVHHTLVSHLGKGCKNDGGGENGKNRDNG